MFACDRRIFEEIGAGVGNEPVELFLFSSTRWWKDGSYGQKLESAAHGEAFAGVILDSSTAVGRDRCDAKARRLSPRWRRDVFGWFVFWREPGPQREQDRNRDGENGKAVFRGSWRQADPSGWNHARQTEKHFFLGFFNNGLQRSEAIGAKAPFNAVGI